MPQELLDRKATKKPKHRSKPYRWDRMGSPVSDPTPWEKTNTRDSRKFDKLVSAMRRRRIR